MEQPLYRPEEDPDQETGFFTPARLVTYARELAAAYPVDEGNKSNYLFERLDHDLQIIKNYTRRTLRLKQPRDLVPASQWLTDNYYIIEEQVHLALDHLPKKYSRGLPSFAGGKYGGRPRIYGLVSEYVAHTDGQLDIPTLEGFIEAYQQVTPLKLGELWAIPIMLRISLIDNLAKITRRLEKEEDEREEARRWIERIKAAAGERPSAVIGMLAEMARVGVPLSSAFVSEFSQGLSSRNSLYGVRAWLGQRLSEEGLSIEEMLQGESHSQAADRISVSQSIGSLRALASIDWREVVEGLSHVERIMRTDPAGVYPAMDFATRDDYRHRVEALSKYSGLSEARVAATAVELAAQGGAAPGGYGPVDAPYSEGSVNAGAGCGDAPDREDTLPKVEPCAVDEAENIPAHVGYYLRDDGLGELSRALGVKYPWRVRRRLAFLSHPLRYYCGGIAVLTLLAAASFLLWLSSAGMDPAGWRAVLLTVVFGFCASQLAVDLMNWLSPRIVKPEILPRMDFSHGVPEVSRTVVVIPTIISDDKGIDELLERLELHYLSNRDDNTFFTLLTDFSDAPQKHMPGDKALLKKAIGGIDELNRRYCDPDRDSAVNGQDDRRDSGRDGNPDGAPNSLYEAGSGQRASQESGPRFFLFHRPREWNPREGIWMARERKRGKLLDFTRYLRSTGQSVFTGTESDKDSVCSHTSATTKSGYSKIPEGPENVCSHTSAPAESGNSKISGGSENVCAHTTAGEKHIPDTPGGRENVRAHISHTDECGFSYISDGAEVLRAVRYVITLDTDTRLPGGAARVMAGAMAHPLNRAVVDPDKNTVVKGYGILQPRVGIDLLSSRCSGYSRLISPDVGIDPYTRAVSDVYQDIFREGSFIGKGIYDVDAFGEVLSGRFPDDKVLSHDLIESNYMHSGLLSDVVVYESCPAGYDTEAARRHRWIRGDWQLVQWLLPKVPEGDGRKARNPVSMLGRWKLLDNLRRSLIPPFTLLFLVLSFILAPSLAPWMLLVILSFSLVLPLAGYLSGVFARTEPRAWLFVQRENIISLGRGLLQAVLWVVMLPYEAYLNLSAIGVTLWRLAVTHRHLLQWRTSSAVEKSRRATIGGFYRMMWFAPVFAVAAAAGAAIIDPRLLLWLSPLVAGWLLSPLIAWAVSRPARDKEVPLTAGETATLRILARKTWGYFETFAGERENWLPPDNFQLVPREVVATRTSPTNIGLGLLAAISAWDLGHLTAGGLLERTGNCLDTLDRLEKYRGHLYNWYDTRSLAPLHPHYISTVDSGNMAGHLLTMAEGLKEVITTPLSLPLLLRGLADTAAVVGSYSGPDEAVNELERLCAAEPATVPEGLDLLAKMHGAAGRLLNSIDPAREEGRKWAATLLRNIEECRRELLWLWPGDGDEFGNGDGNGDGCELVPAAVREILPADLTERLRTVEAGTGPYQLVKMEQSVCASIRALEAVCRQSGNGEALVALSEFSERFSRAVSRARERITAVIRLVRRCTALAGGMDFGFLYDPVKKLFTIGYNVSDRRADTSHYDLLASEARLASYVAIGLGQVPEEHWFYLGRLVMLSHGRPVLLSWSGSMFEYLMPLLVMPRFDRTLLGETYRGALREQKDYAARLGVPWGISESGYNRTDTSMNYQYKAFGVPSLGLRRGLSEQLVITPYATVMAAMVSAGDAYRNMRALSAAGYEGLYGFYEAVDYTPSHLRPEERSVVVRSFMAHHQGMSLVALDNVLGDNRMQARFMACPRMKACELLLQERVPRNVAVNAISDDSQFEIEGVHPLFADEGDSIRRFTDMDIPMEVNLLSNGTYHVMINHTGSGYSRRGDIAVTRWREDPTSDRLGTFVYLREVDGRDSGNGPTAAGGSRNGSNPAGATGFGNTMATFDSVAYQPARREDRPHTAVFSQSTAGFLSGWDGLEVLTTICVSPEDDVEVRRVDLSNRTNRPRRVELTSYLEPVLSPVGADEAHPAFGNLFVETEFVSGSSAVLATRRPRSAGEKPLYMFHIMTAEDDGPVSCETSREAFTGRGRPLSAPRATDRSGPLGGDTGAVLDPCVSLRREVAVPAGEKVSVCVVTGVATSREEALQTVAKYQGVRMAERAFEMAWTHSRVLLVQLGITEAEARLFNKMAGSLVYPNPESRPPQAILKANRRGQDGLWSYGISGDVPIVLVRVSGTEGLPLVRQVVSAHAYWRMKGLTAEVVVLNEDLSVYRQSVHDEITDFISAGIGAGFLESPGGIFVRPLDQVPQGDLDLMQSTARIVLSDRGGSLARQLDRTPVAGVSVPLLRPVPDTERGNSGGSLTSADTARNYTAGKTDKANGGRSDLIFDNGLGGFTPDGTEYVIRTGNGKTTSAPWCNVLANEQFGTVISETDSAYTWAVNAHLYRLTPWNNDPVRDPSGEAIFIRDEESGAFWSPAPFPAGGHGDGGCGLGSDAGDTGGCDGPGGYGVGVSGPGHGKPDAGNTGGGDGPGGYEVRHGFGYSVFLHSRGGISSEMTVFVARSEPVKITRLRLRNNSSRVRKISVTGYCEWVLADQRHRSLPHIQTEIDPVTGVLFARNFYNTTFADRIAFMDITARKSHTADRTEFIGRGRDLSSPAAMSRQRLSGRTGAGLDPCGAVQTHLELAPGAECTVVLRLGSAADKAGMRHLVAMFRQPGTVTAALKEVRGFWERTLTTVQVVTPDRAVDFMANGWLLYQTLACRMWARSGFYQSGGAYGFRDQLQDSMALVHSRPDLVREQILRAASRQFVEGDVQHWWHPPTGRGVRTHFSDDYLWLPYVVCKYVRDVGEEAILDEVVPFIVGRRLRPDEESYYDLPGWTTETDTLYGHCVRSIRYGLKFGEHGLPLMGCGDWNDGMNLVGIGGRGESVWLAFFLYDVLRQFAGVAAGRGDFEFARLCGDEAGKLRANIARHAWDGEWYLRAWFDNGEGLGTRTREECRIDSIPQSWSVISGAGDPGRSAEAMRQVDRQLVDRRAALVKLFTLPFDKSDQEPGYIKGYIPGVRENGGQYTHAAVWTAMAFALAGDADKSWEIFGLINPVRHGDTPEKAALYKVEPYVVAADVYSAPRFAGRGGWTWYTGSSSWMYRLLVETLLGLNRRGDTLVLEPLMPREWDSFRARYRFGGTVYRLIFRRGEQARLVVDGEDRGETNVLQLVDDGQDHNVELIIE